MKPLRVGQIGISHEHAAGKMNTLRLLPDVFEVVGVVDDRASRAARFAGDDLQPYAGLNWMTEAELLATPGLDAVLVETPNADLVPTALRVMERNLPMHMDKPGGECLEPFLRLLEGCRERDLPFQMGYMFRGNPAMQFCLQAVREGWLGEVFEVQGSMSHNYGGEAYQAYLGQFQGGILFNLGCHLLDFFVALLGRPRQVHAIPQSVGGVPETVRNSALAILEYPRATATIRACSLEVGGCGSRRLKICGTRGTIDFCPIERFDGRPLEIELTLSHDTAAYAAGRHVVSFGVIRDRYEAQLTELAQILRGERPNPRAYAHDARVQELLVNLCAAGVEQRCVQCRTRV